ncbi:MAG: hypothetical protein PUP91_21065 [Rhizonema sp. PD37]|nr:hypothetical protein [Rhizonema sp. PD37]
MKLTSLVTSIALFGLFTVSDVPFKAIYPSLTQVSAQEVKVASGETSQQKINQLLAVKGKPGSAKLMRKLYAKDLTPIGIQAGGAGRVVNLYSKVNNTTISLCTTYDVIVAVKKGKIAKFAFAEVK